MTEQAERVQRTSQALRDVMAERERQQAVEGWTPKHDDMHSGAEMARAAAAYCLGIHFINRRRPDSQYSIWPKEWSLEWWKPTTPRRNLVKAGALILAEIERLDRSQLDVESK